MELRQASLLTIRPLRAEAARDGVFLIPAERDLTWYAYYFGPEMASDEICGVCALIRTPTGGRIKYLWTRPRWRGNGFTGMMLDALIEMATDVLLMPRLEALTTRPEFYFERGWKPTGTRTEGAISLARNY